MGYNNKLQCAGSLHKLECIKWLHVHGYVEQPPQNKIVQMEGGAKNIQGQTHTTLKSCIFCVDFMYHLTDKEVIQSRILPFKRKLELIHP